MGNIKLYALSPKQGVTEVVGSTAPKEKQIQKLFEDNLQRLLGVRLLESEYAVDEGRRADTIGLDENDCPVIIEYKRKKSDSATDQVISYRNRLIKNQYKFENLVINMFDMKTAKVAKNKLSDLRLICVAANFSEYAMDAIEEHRKNNIEFIRYRKFGKGLLVLDLLTTSTSTSPVQPAKTPNRRSNGEDYSHRVTKASDAQKERLDALRDFINSLGEDVQEYPVKHYIAFKTTNIFARIRLRNSQGRFLLDLYHLNPEETKSIDDIIEKRGKIVSISIKYKRDLNRTKTYIRKSYKRSATKYSSASKKAHIKRGSKLPPPGTILKSKKYKGRKYEAKVLESGFEFEGRHYKSLTAITKRIKGYKKVSGPAFFLSSSDRGGGTAEKASPRRDPRLPPSGKILTRRFKGRDFRVKVLKEGFELEGHHYKTLSAVAKKITGHKAVSGFYFFGLNDKKKARRKNS